MKSSKSLLLLGWAGVIAVFYLGHALHERSGDQFRPTFETPLSAQNTPRVKVKWEMLAAEGGAPSTMRLSVPGGWLVLAGNGMAFVEDGKRLWLQPQQ